MKSKAELPRFLTAEEVGQALSMHKRTVQLKMKSGEIPARKVGRSYRMAQDDLVLFVRGGKNAVLKARKNS